MRSATAWAGGVALAVAGLLSTTAPGTYVMHDAHRGGSVQPDASRTPAARREEARSILVRLRRRTQGKPRLSRAKKPP